MDLQTEELVVGVLDGALTDVQGRTLMSRVEVIDLLLDFGKPLVVVERTPDASLVERARDRGFDLLTGDASRDDTLDLCNLGAAHSLVALTNVDTLNLEIALGGRALRSAGRTMASVLEQIGVRPRRAALHERGARGQLESA